MYQFRSAKWSSRRGSLQITPKMGQIHPVADNHQPDRLNSGSVNESTIFCRGFRRNGDDEAKVGVVLAKQRCRREQASEVLKVLSSPCTADIGLAAHEHGVNDQVRLIPFPLGQS